MKKRKNRDDGIPIGEIMPTSLSTPTQLTRPCQTPNSICANLPPAHTVIFTSLHPCRRIHYFGINCHNGISATILPALSRRSRSLTRRPSCYGHQASREHLGVEDKAGKMQVYGTGGF